MHHLNEYRSSFESRCLLKVITQRAPSSCQKAGFGSGCIRSWFRSRGRKKGGAWGGTGEPASITWSALLCCKHHSLLPLQRAKRSAPAATRSLPTFPLNPPPSPSGSFFYETVRTGEGTCFFIVGGIVDDRNMDSHVAEKADVSVFLC